ncbi:MAG: EF-P lysine aminoacylase GenX [Desulfobulbaceae bacterium]|nr:EF-P lysine aminoacylase GenX [Desulfobulbaceae bacterium]
MLGRHGLQRRSDFMAALRSFFLEQNYIEVDTPVRLPALIPEAHIVAFSSEDWWLHSSPELCMKRLLARGCEKLFQICHCYRKEECGRLHQSEFSMLEWYRIESDYSDLMTDCEQLLTYLSAGLAHFPALQKPGCLHWQNMLINLNPPWQRLSVHDAFRRYAGMEVEEAMARDLYEELLVSCIEPQLGQEAPVFLYDYPLALGSLARTSAANPQVAERFELYLAGIELANGFSELTNVAEQRFRFEKEIATLQAQGRHAAMPERFLDDLACMPAAAGIALGVDRLFMLLGNYDDIRQAIPFPAETL